MWNIKISSFKKKDEIRVRCFQSVELQLLSGRPVLFKERESFKIWPSQHICVEVHHGRNKGDFQGAQKNNILLLIKVGKGYLKFNFQNSCS